MKGTSIAVQRDFAGSDRPFAMTTFGSTADEALKARARSWQLERRRVLRDPAPEAIHRLRTAARRLEAAGRIATDQFGLTASLPWPDGDSLNSKLSRLRDLDVTRQLLQEPRLEGQPNNEVLRQRLEELARERKRARRRAVTELERHRSGRIARRVARLASRLSPPADLAMAAQSWWALEGETFTIDPVLRQSLGPALRRRSGQAAVHQIRIRLRNLRYGLEWWSDLGLVVSPPVVAFLRDAQETLGRIRDYQRTATALAGPGLRRFRSAVVAARRIEIAHWPSVAERGDLLGVSPFEGIP